ncbi:hypothetical protein ACOMHN_046990 [Nucella lapillus]
MRAKGKEAKVTELNSNLVCVLCGGYFIDATTLTECLHSFCKSCILKRLKTSKHCPVCDVLVHKTRPHLHIRSDKTLQDLVYKLIPGLYKDEMKRRRDFYAKHPHESPVKAGEERGAENVERILYSKDDKFSLALHFCSRGVRDDWAVHPLSLPEVTASSQEPAKDVRYLQCPGGVTVLILKRFVRHKYDLSPHYHVDIFHSDEALCDHYTLIDVAYIYTWRRKEALKLSFSVYELLTKRRKIDRADNPRLLDLKRLSKEEDPTDDIKGDLKEVGPRGKVKTEDVHCELPEGKPDKDCVQKASPTPANSPGEGKTAEPIDCKKSGGEQTKGDAGLTEGALSSGVSALTLTPSPSSLVPPAPTPADSKAAPRQTGGKAQAGQRTSAQRAGKADAPAHPAVPDRPGSAVTASGSRPCPVPTPQFVTVGKPVLTGNRQIVMANVPQPARPAPLLIAPAPPSGKRLLSPALRVVSAEPPSKRKAAVPGQVTTRRPLVTLSSLKAAASLHAAAHPARSLLTRTVPGAGGAAAVKAMSGGVRILPKKVSGPAVVQQASNVQTALVQASKVQMALPQASKVQSASLNASKVQSASPQASKVQTASVQASKVQSASLNASKVQMALPQASKVQMALPQASKVQIASLQASKLQSASLQAAQAHILQAARTLTSLQTPRAATPLQGPQPTASPQVPRPQPAPSKVHMSVQASDSPLPGHGPLVVVAKGVAHPAQVLVTPPTAALNGQSLLTPGRKLDAPGPMVKQDKTLPRSVSASTSAPTISNSAPTISIISISAGAPSLSSSASCKNSAQAKASLSANSGSQNGSQRSGQQSLLSGRSTQSSSSSSPAPLSAAPSLSVPQSLHSVSSPAAEFLGGPASRASADAVSVPVSLHGGAVPSAAAAAAGAASPSPASLAASSSPSPPMASSASSVREETETVSKRIVSAPTFPALTPALSGPPTSQRSAAGQKGPAVSSLMSGLKCAVSEKVQPAKAAGPGAEPALSGPPTSQWSAAGQKGPAVSSLMSSLKCAVSEKVQPAKAAGPSAEPAPSPQTPGLTQPAPSPQTPGLTQPAPSPPAPSPQTPGLTQPAPSPQTPGLSQPAPSPQTPGLTHPASQPRGQSNGSCRNRSESCSPAKNSTPGGNGVSGGDSQSAGSAQPPTSEACSMAKASVTGGDTAGGKKQAVAPGKPADTRGELPASAVKSATPAVSEGKVLTARVPPAGVHAMPQTAAKPDTLKSVVPSAGQAAVSRAVGVGVSKGPLSSRNGMPTVVSRPTRVINASTSVNTLSHRLPMPTRLTTPTVSLHALRLPVSSVGVTKGPVVTSAGLGAKVTAASVGTLAHKLPASAVAMVTPSSKPSAAPSLSSVSCAAVSSAKVPVTCVVVCSGSGARPTVSASVSRPAVTPVPVSMNPSVAVTPLVLPTPTGAPSVVGAGSSAKTVSTVSHKPVVKAAPVSALVKPATPVSAPSAAPCGPVGAPVSKPVVTCAAGPPGPKPVVTCVPVAVSGQHKGSAGSSSGIKSCSVPLTDITKQQGALMSQTTSLTLPPSSTSFSSSTSSSIASPAVTASSVLPAPGPSPSPQSTSTLLPSISLQPVPKSVSSPHGDSNTKSGGVSLVTPKPSQSPSASKASSPSSAVTDIKSSSAVNKVRPQTVTTTSVMLPPNVGKAVTLGHGGSKSMTLSASQGMKVCSVPTSYTGSASALQEAGALNPGYLTHPALLRPSGAAIFQALGRSGQGVAPLRQPSAKPAGTSSSGSQTCLGKAGAQAQTSRPKGSVTPVPVQSLRASQLQLQAFAQQQAKQHQLLELQLLQQQQHLLSMRAMAALAAGYPLQTPGAAAALMAANQLPVGVLGPVCASPLSPQPLPSQLPVSESAKKAAADSAKKLASDSAKKSAQGTKKAGESSGKKKISDIANSLHRKMSQTVGGEGGGGGGGGRGQTSSPSFSDHRPPVAHSSAASPTTSTSSTSSSSSSSRPKADDEQPLNLVTRSGQEKSGH